MSKTVMPRPLLTILVFANLDIDVQCVHHYLLKMPNTGPISEISFVAEPMAIGPTFDTIRSPMG